MDQKSIDFFRDERETTEDLGANDCEGIIDDSSNYEFNIDGNQITIWTLAKHQRGALLIVSCPEKEIIYSLSFKNKNKNQTTDSAYLQTDKRPESSVDASYSTNNNSNKSYTVAVSDRSYGPLELRSQRSVPNISEQQYHNDSVDLFHRFDDSSLGYGAGRQTTKDGDKRVFRSSGGIYGYNMNSEWTRKVRTSDRSQKHILTTPTPVNLRFVYHQQEDSSISRKLLRSFFGSWGKIRDRVSTEIDHKTHQDSEQNYTRLNFDNTLSFNFASYFRQAKRMGGYCNAGEKCRLTSLRLVPEISLSSMRFEIDYGLIPHDINASAEYKFNRDNRLILTAAKALYTQNWTKKYDWIEGTSEAGQVQANSSLSLMYTHWPFYYSAGYNQPLYPDNVVKNFSLSTGLRHEGKSHTFSINYTTQPLMEVPSHFFMARISYYFDRNIQSYVYRSSSHKLSGKVESAYTKQSVEDCQVQLYVDNQLYASTQSDAEGMFRFKDIPQEGSIRVVATKGILSKEKTFTKQLNENDIKTIILIDDFWVADVQFVLDKNRNGKIDKNIDQPVSIKNYDSMIGEGIVQHPKAKYRGNKLILPRQKQPLELTIRQEYLPFSFELIRVYNKTLNSPKGQEKQVVHVLLRRR